MIWKKKVKAGALQLVLGIGAIIAVLLLTFVLLAHTHNFFHKKTDSTIALIHSSQSALESSFEVKLDVNQDRKVDQENEFGIKTSVTKSFWGMLELRRAVATKGKSGFTRIALVGRQNSELSGLYLADNQRPLVVAGNAKITGTAFLPERGLKMGNIAGNGYRRGELLFGRQSQSQAQLPRLSNEVLQQLKACIEGNFPIDGETLAFEPDLQVKNSFLKPTQVIQGERLILDKSTLVGNIIVRASKEIIVEPSAYLQDIVLAAPKITFNPGFNGNVQAFATRSIEVGKRCKLAYPSVLAVSPKSDSSNQMTLKPHVHLSEFTELRGHLLYLDDRELNRSVPHISIQTGATVVGEVYTTQNVELKGKVFGNVTANGFVALENGSIYQNHLYQGQIDATSLPMEYGGLVYENEVPQTIMKWMY